VNIFYLHHAPIISASLHCDKHVVKMILETAQMMSTIYHIYGHADIAPYKPTHAHHPSVNWASENKANYEWLAELGRHLCNEYAIRYGSRHTCEPIITQLLKDPPPELKAGPYRFTEPPQMMPDDCKVENNAVEAYRQYYRKYKASFAKWKLDGPPGFMIGAVAN
jgi:hypothetical protein